MNVRLEELVRQATVKVKHEIKPGIWGTKEDLDKEEFAKLVADDCYKVCVVALHQKMDAVELKKKLNDRFGFKNA
jgi:phosphoribosyl-ATP pyrophosphohydrolase